MLSQPYTVVLTRVEALGYLVVRDMGSETRWECMTSCVFLNLPGLHFLPRIIGVVDGMPLLRSYRQAELHQAHGGPTLAFVPLLLNLECRPGALGSLSGRK